MKLPSPDQLLKTSKIIEKLRTRVVVSCSNRYLHLLDAALGFFLAPTTFRTENRENELNCCFSVTTRVIKRFSHFPWNVSGRSLSAFYGCQMVDISKRVIEVHHFLKMPYKILANLYWSSRILRQRFPNSQESRTSFFPVIRFCSWPRTLKRTWLARHVPNAAFPFHAPR